MKKFNQDIEIKVSVDSIADKLLSTIGADEKHRELIAETVIGTILNTRGPGIGMLYNALNGFTNEINFKVDDNVNCTEKVYRGDAYEKMGNAIVKEVDIYREDKLKVEYHAGEKTGTKWVNHENCNKLGIEDLLAGESVEEIDYTRTKDCL